MSHSSGHNQTFRECFQHIHKDTCKIWFWSYEDLRSYGQFNVKFCQEYCALRFVSAFRLSYCLLFPNSCSFTTKWHKESYEVKANLILFASCKILHQFLRKFLSTVCNDGQQLTLELAALQLPVRKLEVSSIGHLERANCMR